MDVSLASLMIFPKGKYALVAQLNQLKIDCKTLKEKNITLELSEEALRFVAEAGYDPAYGARPLKRYIQRKLETSLARALLEEKITEGQSVKVFIRDGALTFGFPE